MAGWLRSVRSIEAADEAERGSLMRARAFKISIALPTASAMWRIHPCIPVWFSSFLCAPVAPFRSVCCLRYSPMLDACFDFLKISQCWLYRRLFSWSIEVEHWLICRRKAFFTIGDESKYSFRNESKNNYIEWKKNNDKINKKLNERIMDILFYKILLFVQTKIYSNNIEHRFLLVASFPPCSFPRPCRSVPGFASPGPLLVPPRRPPPAFVLLFGRRPHAGRYIFPSTRHSSRCDPRI